MYMNLLTDGHVIIMVSNGVIKRVPFTHDLSNLDDSMCWNTVHPKIHNLHDVREYCPELFLKGGMNYIPNLHFVRIDLRAYYDAWYEHDQNGPRHTDFMYEDKETPVHLHDILNNVQTKLDWESPEKSGNATNTENKGE